MHSSDERGWKLLIRCIQMIGQSSSVIKSCLFNWENSENFSALFVWQSSKIQHFKFTISYKKKSQVSKKSIWIQIHHMPLSISNSRILKIWPFKKVTKIQKSTAASNQTRNFKAFEDGSCTCCQKFMSAENFWQKIS